MSIKLSNTFLFVRDIEASKQFYVDNLDQQITQCLDGYVVFSSGLAIWQLPDDSIILQKLYNRLSERSNNRVELYFETDNVDMCFTRLKNNQVEFLHEIHEEPWGQRDFRFFDPDNNLVEIGEAMDNVALRLYNAGMNIKQIEAKTGMEEKYLQEVVIKNKKIT